MTRPDICYIVTKLSCNRTVRNRKCHAKKPPQVDLITAKHVLHVLRYLKGMQDIGLTFRKTPPAQPLKDFDSDWGELQFLAFTRWSPAIKEKLKKPTVALKWSM